MKFPIHVYKCPGSTFSTKGVTYNLKAVYSATELDRAHSEGWAMSLDEAARNVRVRDLTPHRKYRKIIVEVSVDDSANDAPPTRQEMEVKADELGIKYDGRTSDKRLLERISEALNELDKATIC